MTLVGTLMMSELTQSLGLTKDDQTQNFDIAPGETIKSPSPLVGHLLISIPRKIHHRSNNAEADVTVTGDVDPL